MRQFGLSLGQRHLNHQSSSDDATSNDKLITSSAFVLCKMRPSIGPPVHPSLYSGQIHVSAARRELAADGLGALPEPALGLLRRHLPGHQLGQKLLLRRGQSWGVRGIHGGVRVGGVPLGPLSLLGVLLADLKKRCVRRRFTQGIYMYSKMLVLSYPQLRGASPGGT